MITKSIENRPYQTRIITKALQKFNAGIDSVLIESPTGSGKTVMGLEVAKALQDEFDCGIGWVAMRKNLLAQVERAIEDFGLKITLETISMFAKNPPLEDRDGRRISLLVCDEGHHDATSSMAHLHNTIKPKHILGLTATPFRSDHVKLCFSSVLKDAGIHTLISQGYLSPYHQFTIPEWSVDSVCEHYLRDKERWGKSVMFWQTRSEAQQCCDKLESGGVRVALVTADNDPKLERRERQISAFESGEIDVLVNMYILTEGFDSPSLKTVWVRDSSKVPTIQMAGRVFRKYPGIEYKQVVQSKATRWPIHRTASPAEAFVWGDGRWSGYRQSKKADRVATLTARSLAHIDVALPSFITRQKKQRRWYDRNR